MTDDGQVGGRRAVADILVQVVARAGNLLLGIVATLVLVRTLGEDDFGRWATLLSITQIAMVFVDLGLEPAIVSLAAKDPDREGSWVGALVSLRLLFAIPATIISIVICLILADNDDMALAGVLLSCTMLAAAPSALRVLNQLRVRNDVTMFVLTVNSVLWTGAVVGLAIAKVSMAAYAAAFLAVTFAAATLQMVLSRPQMRHRLRLARELWPQALKAGLPLGIAGVISTAAARAPQIFVFELDGTREAGLYGAATRLYEQSHFIPMAVVTTLLPIMAMAHKANPERARRVLEMSVGYLLMVSLPVFVLTLAASPEILTLLFGESFRDAAPALPILMATFVLVAVNYPLDNMIIVQGEQKWLVGRALIAMVIIIVGTAATVPFVGFVGAAAAVLAAEAVVTFQTFRFVSGTLGGALRARPLLRILAAGAIAMLVLEAIDLLIGAPLGVLILVLAVVYPAALLLLGALDLDEARRLIRRQPPPDLEAEPTPDP